MRKNCGFTLVELIVVMVLMGILASTLAVFFRPAMDAFFDARRRADMTDATDTALRRMAQDIRRAVPNSLNVIDGTTADGNAACLQIVPTIGGGRYRTDIDTAVPATAALNLDSAAPFRLNVLAQQGNAPAANDFVVINNQNGDDVYNGASRASIINVGPPLTLNANPTASGYMGGRFQLVANAESSVMYTCANNQLTRRVFNGAPARRLACEVDGALVAGNVGECTFTYDAAGATFGLLTLRLVMRDVAAGESVTLGYGIHMDNTP